MNETIGEFVEDKRTPLSGVSVELAALDFVAHWHRCGLTADWLAKVAAYDFEHREIATSVLSTVVNELLENAAKFASDKRAPVRLSLHHYGDVVRIETRNVVSAEGVATLRRALTDIAESDLEALFATRIEHPSPTTSGLGLIILRKDYGAAIGVRLHGEAERFVVEIQVTLQAEEVEQG